MLFQEITWEEFAELRAKEAAEDSFQEGFREGSKQGIRALILSNRSDGVPEPEIKEKLTDWFGLTAQEAEAYLLEFTE